VEIRPEPRRCAAKGEIRPFLHRKHQPAAGLQDPLSHHQNRAFGARTMITRRYEQLGIRNRCYYWSLVVCFGVALFFAHRTLACSIAYEANISFDPEEFVFEGVVLVFVADSSLYAGGYANYYLDSDEDFEPAGGLIVRPTDSINIPIQADSFLVFPA